MSNNHRTFASAIVYVPSFFESVLCWVLLSLYTTSAKRRWIKKNRVWVTSESNKIHEKRYIASWERKKVAVTHGAQSVWINNTSTSLGLLTPILKHRCIVKSLHRLAWYDRTIKKGPKKKCIIVWLTYYASWFRRKMVMYFSNHQHFFVFVPYKKKKRHALGMSRRDMLSSQYAIFSINVLFDHLSSLRVSLVAKVRGPRSCIFHTNAQRTLRFDPNPALRFWGRNIWRRKRQSVEREQIELVKMKSRISPSRIASLRVIQNNNAKKKAFVIFPAVGTQWVISKSKKRSPVLFEAGVAYNTQDDVCKNAQTIRG